MTTYQGVLIDEGGAFYNVKAGGAKGDTRVVPGGAITAGSTLLTVTGGTFSAQDVGKVISVAGAGAPIGATATLYGITYAPPRNNLGGAIQSYVSATQVHLSTAAGTTVTNATVTYGSNDTTAIQTALDNHTHVYLPPGRYTLTTALRVARGGVTLRGAGANLSVLTGSVDLPSFLSFSSYTGALIENLELVGVGFDGAPDRLKIQGIGITNARRVSVRQVAGASLEGFLGFEYAFDWVLTEFSTVDTMDTISVYRSGEGTISDGRILRSNEGLDFFGGTDVTVSNVVITSHAAGEHPGIYQVGIDFSSSKRVTFSGVVVRGDFMRGAHLKQEEDPAPAMQDILFTGCEFHDFYQFGVYLTAGVATPPGEAGVPNRGLRLDGCIVRSAKAEATGVYISADAANEYQEVVIAGCTIDVPVQAVRNTDYDRLEIRDSFLRVSGAEAAVFVSGVNGVLLEGCRVAGGTGYGVDLRGVTDPRVEGCKVTAGGSAIVLLECRRPVVRGNEVPGGPYQAVYLLWSGTSGLDTTNNTIGAVIDHNLVRNWGTGGTGIGAIEVRFTGVTGTYRALSVSGNRLLLDNASPGTQGQIGILFSKGGLTSIDWAKVDDNLIYGAAVGIGNETDLGANSTRVNNSVKVGLP
jgi:hypothetical protein